MVLIVSSSEREEAGRVDTAFLAATVWSELVSEAREKESGGDLTWD